MKSRFIPFGSKGYLHGAADKVGGEPRVIHVVDDLAEGLHFVAVVLGQAGYQTSLHSNLADLTLDYRDASTAAVLIDVRLREEDATDVLDFLRRAGCTAPIYLISGDLSALESSKRYAEEIGLPVTDIIAKPFTGKQILDRLQRKPGGLREVFDQIDVAEAVREGWIYPVLQPKLDIACGKIRSAELLSRMSHPEFGVVPPQRFVPHLSVEQNQTLFLQNIAYARRHFAYDPRRGNDFPISINVDASNLVQVRSELKEIAADSPFVFRNLLFEITEEAIGSISDEQLKMLYKLSLDGARISIDDFGVGHSNFARLSRLPFSEIKIDRSLVHGCSTNHSRGIMIKSIIGMARDLKARVVAEGVELMTDLQFLQDLKCDEAQGYLIGRPMKLERFEAFVAEFNGRGQPERPVAAALTVKV